MKRLLFLPFWLAAALVFSQENQPPQLVYLTDGSFLKGAVVETTPDSLVRIRLAGGAEILLPQSLVWQVRQSRSDDLLLPDGRRMLEKGGYSSVSFHLLSGKRSSEFEPGKRWGAGGHFSAGWQFRPLLALGAGLGLDVHEYFFLPVFVEARGFLVKPKPKARKSGGKESSVEWFGRPAKGGGTGRKFPLCYSVQAGRNLPLEGIFGKDEQFKVKGGWLLYPSVGLQFPSRSGTTFQFDVGYKFQRFSRKHEDSWWGVSTTTDQIRLRSFAMRAGWIF